MPDRLGQTVTVVGVVTSEPVILGQAAVQAHFQDTTGGITLFARETAMLAGRVSRGDLVRVRGKIEVYKGIEELVVEDLRRLDSGRVVQPRDVMVADLIGETYSGQLVRVVGQIEVPPDFSAEKHGGLWLRDRSGELTVFIRSRMFQSPTFMARLAQGGHVEVVGIASQYDEQPPFTSSYQLIPRDPDDFMFEPVPPYRAIALSAAAAASVGFVAYLWMRRRSAERRARDLEQRLVERAERDKLAAIVEHSDSFIATALPDGTMLFINPAGRALVGLETSDGHMMRTIFEYVVEEDVGTLRERLLPCVLNEGRSQCEVRFSHALTGARIPVALNAFLIRDSATGEAAAVAFSGRDCTERKRAEEEIRLLNADLERRVAERTTELAASNRELEAFSYSVSHDLRAPLRAIDGFSQALLEDHADKLDAQAKGHLARVRAASQRMADLIDDLLNLSRVTRSEMRRDRVDLTAQAYAIAEELKHTRPARDVTFQIEPGVQAIGDPRLLRVALQNLLENAWKFTEKRPCARVEFGMTRDNGTPIYFVRDNGAGFDMAHASKLFGAFQRLHGEREFGGTGIGLATVQRIVTRHGGRVWAEAAVDQGATVSFTL